MVKQQYKVEAYGFIGDAADFQQFLNKNYLDGWELHSVTPQAVSGINQNIITFVRNEKHPN
ncbi:hypothetical protein [Paenibacillus gallinarum]|uniref:DUF4177 domain-containing protein n=1 Tax=Paenibacillus gallinarum TaxID=2762232 RepID=A0ABR8SW65_9BACL|nr:hypothetical protein [Paenibacillus gallinarum]MBD7967749.1 hypothetical protein [Paenibacillus gallinarum]